MEMRVAGVPRPWRRGERRRGWRITDEAYLINERAAAEIMRTIRNAEEETGTEVMIVTLPTIGGFSPKAFATALFNRWGVGTASRNNGVLVLVIKDARRVEVEVGSALNSRFSREWTESMLRRSVLPHFRDGRYSEGLVSCGHRIAERLTGTGSRAAVSSDDATNLAVFGVSFGVVGGALVLSNWEAERRSRKCDGCGTIVPPGRATDWQTVKAAGYMIDGKQERVLECQKCGARSIKMKKIPMYDRQRRGRDGEWYYYRSSDDSDSGGGGSSDGGGGGGGDW